MKYTILALLIFFSYSNTILAQESTTSIKIVKFEEIETKPRFEDCDLERESDCTLDKINNFIQENFEKSELNESILNEEKVALLKFFIDTSGTVIRPYVISKSKNFKSSILPIIRTLPNFTPGLHLNKPAIVMVEIPINFSTPVEVIYNYNDKTLNSLAILEKCSKEENPVSCTSTRIQNWILRGVKTDNIKLPADVVISANVGFVVNEDGVVSQIEVKGAYSEFNKEIKRVVEKLPKFLPAIKDEQPVKVLIQFPVKLMIGD